MPSEILNTTFLIAFLSLELAIAVVAWSAGRRTPAVGAPRRGIFTSQREQRLWLWTLAVVVAIYATLGQAPALAAYLRERNLLRLSLAFVMVPVLAAMLWRWARSRPGWGEIGVVLAFTAVYVMVFVRINLPEERTHLFEYSLVGALIYLALVERRRNGRRVPAPVVLAVVLTTVIGSLDEGIQALLPHRVFDARDILFNALAGLMAIGATAAIGWVRGRWRRAR